MAVGLAYQRPEVVGKPVRLAPRPVSLAGREVLLAELGDRLGDGAGPRIVALCGLGGAGKTSVAVEYAHRHLGEVGVAWQLAAEDPTVLAAGFGELAAQLGAQDLLVKRDPVASVHGVFAAFPARWLLVFDNAPDRASVQAFLPPAGNGQVLITSQSPLWPPGQAVDVPVLGTGVAAEFLAGRSGDLDRQAAAELAGELGGLPLALEQAAAYVQATGDSLAGYLASFRHRSMDLLRRGEPAEYGRSVAATWALAFARLEQSAPLAVGLLRLLAFCAPDAIPLRLLMRPWAGLAGELGPRVASALAPLLEDELAAGDAIAALRRYSLIGPPVRGVVSVPARLGPQTRPVAGAISEQRLTVGGGNTPTWARWPEGRTSLERRLDGGGHELCGIGVDGDVPAKQHAADDLWQYNGTERICRRPGRRSAWEITAHAGYPASGAKHRARDLRGDPGFGAAELLTGIAAAQLAGEDFLTGWTASALMRQASRSRRCRAWHPPPRPIRPGDHACSVTGGGAWPGRGHQPDAVAAAGGAGRGAG